jgi:hypothetical protein
MWHTFTHGVVMEQKNNDDCKIGTNKSIKPQTLKLTYTYPNIGKSCCYMGMNRNCSQEKNPKHNKHVKK